MPALSAHFPRPRRARRLRDLGRAGFTLVEVTAAAVVMALVITTSLVTLQHGYRSIDVARNTTLAAQIMQSEIERLRLMNWSQVGALPASETVAIDPTFAHVATRFSCVRTIATTKTDMKEITLAASWSGVDGRDHTVTYRTRYTRHGLNDYFYTAHQ